MINSPTGWQAETRTPYIASYTQASTSHLSSLAEQQPLCLFLVLGSQWLDMVCTEARKQDGDQYWFKTIQHYLKGLQRHIRTQKKNAVNFMVDAEFPPLRNLLDALYRRLHVKGDLALAQSLKGFTHFFMSVVISLGMKPCCNSSKLSSAFNDSNYLCIFRAATYLVNHLLHAFSSVLRTLLHETQGRKAPKALRQ